jgi:hypothetical protein
VIEQHHLRNHGDHLLLDLAFKILPLRHQITSLDDRLNLSRNFKILGIPRFTNL